jgi:hypothetical protein
MESRERKAKRCKSLSKTILLKAAGYRMGLPVNSGAHGKILYDGIVR